MAKKVQLPVVGGIRKVVLTGDTTPAGTTIAEIGSNTITLAQLAALLGTLVPDDSGTIGGGPTASILVGPGLTGGGPVLGVVPIGLTAPVSTHLLDYGTGNGEEGAIGPPGLPGASGVQGLRGAPGDDGVPGDDGSPGPPGVAGATGAQGAQGAAIFLEADPGADGEWIPGPQGPIGATGPQGPAGTGGGSSPYEILFLEMVPEDAWFQGVGTVYPSGALVVQGPIAQNGGNTLTISGGNTIAATASLTLSATGAAQVLTLKNNASSSTYDATGHWVIPAPTNPAQATVTISGDSGQYCQELIGNAVNTSFGLAVLAGTSNIDVSAKFMNQTGTKLFLQISGDGSVQVGAPAGGGEGLGSINMQAGYINGVPIGSTGPSPVSLAFEYVYEDNWFSGVGTTYPGGPLTVDGAFVVQNAAGTDAIAVQYSQQSGQGFVLNASGASAADVRGINITNSTNGATSGTYGLIVNNSGTNGMTIGKTAPAWSGSKWTNCPAGEISWVMSGGAIPLVFGVNQAQNLGISSTGLVTVGPPNSGTGTALTVKAIAVGHSLDILPADSASVGIQIQDPGLNATQLRVNTNNTQTSIQFNGTVSQGSLSIGAHDVITLNTTQQATINAPVTAVTSLTVNGTAGTNNFAQLINGGATANQSNGLQILAGTSASDAALSVGNGAVTATLFAVLGNGVTQAPTSPLGSAKTQVFTGLANFKSALSTSANATLTADAALTVTCNETGWYTVECFLNFYEATSGTGGFQFDFNAGSAVVASPVFAASGFSTAAFSNAAITSISTATGIGTVGTSSAAPSWVRVTGTIHVTTAGSFGIRWAQNTILAIDPTTLAAGSSITLTKIG